MKGTTEKITSQEGGLLSTFLCLLTKFGLLLIKNVLTPLANSVSNPLGLTTAASATDVAIQKKIYGLGITAMIILNEEMKDIMEILKYLKKSG